MKILLLGSRGQIGSSLLPKLAELGEVTALNSKQLDMLDLPAVRSTLNQTRPDLIINAAAYTHVDLAESNQGLAIAINADAPRALAKWAAENRSHLIHFSTDYVFDGVATSPYDENATCNPLNVYGRSKLEGDQAIVESGCSHFIFRTSWVYSSHGRNFLLTMLQNGLEKTELKVVNDQIGAPTSAEFIARNAVMVMKSFEGQGIYNLTCAGETSWYGFAESIFAQSSDLGWKFKLDRLMPISSEEFSAPAKRPLNSRLSLEKIQKAFGVCPAHWKEALRECLMEIRPFQGSEANNSSYA